MLQNSGNILLISLDEKELARLRNLFVEDYNVFSASTIRDAHKVLKYYDVHVMAVDQQMDEMTGMQFCESVDHAYPDVIKVILTETSDTVSLDRAAKSELIYRYLEKPFTNGDLRMTVAGAMRLSEAEYQNKLLRKELDKYKSERENILKTFKRYVPGEVVSQALVSDEEQIMKPGESRIVTVLFADIREFTNFTSNLPPSEVVNFLNDYWEVVTECVKNHKGSVNKYMGDGMLAVFGAPVSHLNNHANAVSAALDMIKSLDAINKMYREILNKEIMIGIGINTGEVVVGNVGTEDYMEYSVIGDTVNIASRLEDLSKEKPNSILISERTYKMVKDEFEISEPMYAKINGKQEQIAYYQVFGEKPGNIYDISSKKGS